MGQGKQRKLTGIALAKLVSTGNVKVLGVLEPIFTIITSVAIEIEGFDKKESLLFTYEPRDIDQNEGSYEAIRREALRAADPVMQDGSLICILRDSLAGCERRLGFTSFQEVLGRVDPEILMQLKYIIR